MPSVTFFQYFDYLRSRWRWIAVACATAMALAFGITLLLPKEYTASARILIDSGSGVDPRSAIAVSSIYLESLKTYEAFAASEQLFQQAVDKFQLRDGRGSLQSLHSSVLKVRVLPGTRLLEIRCTLPDPQKAHALAVYLADETIKLSRGVSQQSDDETIARAEKQFELAKARLDQVYAAQRGAAGVSETERSSAREGFEEAERRLADARAAAGYRTERLAIVDPGVAPERPSSPRMLVNLIAALWIAAVASILFLTLQFSYSRRPTAEFTRARRGNYD